MSAVEAKVVVAATDAGATPPTAAASNLTQRLQIGKSVGSGAFAIVHQATYEGQPVALKILLPHLGPTSKEDCPVKMFIREGQLLRRVNHAHIARCLAILELPPDFPGLARGYVRPTWALVLELLEGGSLCSLMHKQLLAPWKFLYDNVTALAWSTQIASALAHLHGLSPPVIHRDVKLDNAMLALEPGRGGRTAVAKLVDLGLYTRPAGEGRGAGRMTLLRAALPRLPHRRSLSEPARLSGLPEGGAGPEAGAQVAPGVVVADEGETVLPEPSTAAATTAVVGACGGACVCVGGSFCTGTLAAAPARAGPPRPPTTPSSLPMATDGSSGNSGGGGGSPRGASEQHMLLGSGAGERTGSCCLVAPPDATAACSRAISSTPLFYRVSDGGNTLLPVQVDPVEATSGAVSGAVAGDAAASGAVASAPLSSCPGSGTLRQMQARAPYLGDVLRSGSCLGAVTGSASPRLAPAGGPSRSSLGSRLLPTVPAALAGVDGSPGVLSRLGLRPGSGLGSASGLGLGAVGSVGLVLSSGRGTTPRCGARPMARVSETPETAATESVPGAVLDVPGSSRGFAGVGTSVRPPTAVVRPGSAVGSRPGSAGAAVTAAAVAPCPSQGVANSTQGPPPAAAAAAALRIHQWQAQRIDAGGWERGDGGITTSRVNSIIAWQDSNGATGSAAATSVAVAVVAGSSSERPRDADGVSLNLGTAAAASSIGHDGGCIGVAPCGIGGGGGGFVYSLSASTCLGDTPSCRPSSGGAPDGRGRGKGIGPSAAGPPPPRGCSVGGCSSAPCSVVGAHLKPTTPPCALPQLLRVLDGETPPSRPATPGDVQLGVWRAGAMAGGGRATGSGASFDGKLDASFSVGMEVVYCLTGETGSCMTMAPEIKLMQPYNEKIDVYAFGIVLYEIWSRSLLAVSYIGTKRPDLPYMVHRVTDWPDLVASGFRPARVDAIPGPVWELISECWDQDPLARPSMAEVEVRLRRMAEEPELAEAVTGLTSGKGGRKLRAGSAAHTSGAQRSVAADRRCGCVIS